MKEQYKGEYEWRALLTEVMGEKAHERLCDCVSRKSDVPLLAKCYKRKRNMNSEDALIMALEHMSMNSQDFDYTQEEWDKWVRSVERFK